MEPELLLKPTTSSNEKIHENILIEEFEFELSWCEMSLSCHGAKCRSAKCRDTKQLFIEKLTFGNV